MKSPYMNDLKGADMDLLDEVATKLQDSYFLYSTNDGKSYINFDISAGEMLDIISVLIPQLLKLNSSIDELTSVFRSMVENSEGGPPIEPLPEPLGGL